MAKIFSTRSLLFLTCVFAVLIISPAMPGDGLDPSWRHGINEAVARKFSFGREVIFSFGPYGVLYTGIYHPATDNMALFASLGLGLAFGSASLLALQRAHWIPLLLLSAALSGLIFLRDPLFFCYPFIVGLVCLDYAHSRVDTSGARMTFISTKGPIWLWFGLLFAPFGLLMIVKGGSVPQCMLILLASVMLFARARNLPLAIAVALSPLFSMVLLWRIAEQDLQSLPSYLMAMSSVTAGYSEAMATPGPPIEVYLYLFSGACLLLIVAKHNFLSVVNRLYLLTILGTTIFVAFKGGFVRHDGHATMAGVTILLCSLLVWAGQSPRGIYLGLIPAFITWYQIDQHYMHSTAESILRSVRTTWTEPFSGAARRFRDPEYLRKGYAATLDQIHKQSPLPVMAGSVDIYSYNQTQLLASGNNWNPRPVFQSYSAYSTDLLTKNLSHLAGLKAPDHIFFRIEPIDDRLPSTEDGASWPLLLTRYLARAIDTNTALLDLDQTRPNAPALIPLLVQEQELGQTIAVPVSKSSLMVELKIEQSFGGRLINLFYKPESLYITLILNDGSSKSFRLVSGMARSGFLLTPLVLNVNDFVALGQIQPTPDSRIVRAFTISPLKASWQWRKTVEVRFTELNLAQFHSR